MVSKYTLLNSSQIKHSPVQTEGWTMTWQKKQQGIFCSIKTKESQVKVGKVLEYL